jgi:hypothetical protein
LSEAPSAYDLDFASAPLNLYTKPARIQMQDDASNLLEGKKKTSLRKILAGIQQEVET